MLVLHGSWMLPQRGRDARFAVWGELVESKPPWIGRKRKAEDGPPRPRRHPFAAPADRLCEALAAAGVPAAAAESATVLVRLPAAGGMPLPSPQLAAHAGAVPETTPTLAPWRVEALLLDIAAVVERFPALTPAEMAAGVALGDDLSFWGAVSRLALELLYRQRVMPTLQRQRHRYLARWQPLLDEWGDIERFGTLMRAMPPACRAPAWRAADPLPQPQTLLNSFLAAAVDGVARRAMASVAPPTRPAYYSYYGGEAWIQALAGDPAIDAWRYYLDQLYQQFHAADEPPRTPGAAEQQLRVCFRLEPPPAGMPGPGEGTPVWTLRYLLQATDDPSLLVPAEEVWRRGGDNARLLGRRFERPQEALLAGLGRAARVYPPLAATLREARPEACRLTVAEAYAFLREKALQLRTAGFGVLVPGLETKLGLRLKLGRKADAGPSDGPSLFGVDTLVNFDWQLALGGESISREEFEALVKLKEPLVEVRGHWVELRPELVERALAFFQKQPAAGELRMAEALRLALAPDGGDGLEVEGVETEGWFDDLLRRLGDGAGREQVGQPAGFAGRLRPYQETGVSWLASLRRYGLGACLADDMGLGKCTIGQSLIGVNGVLRTAEATWESYAGEALFDGEGFWAEPTEALLVNAIDQETGRMALAPVRRLYRQKVREKLRTVRLEDGSSITITRRHKLLTSTGWTNNLQPGDYVCVPARMVWDGPSVDPDLITFLAWQIAEGNELREIASLRITQKDPTVLEDLMSGLQAISARYGIRINRPVIRPKGKGCYDLVLHSRDYQEFLQQRGYSWGRVSRQKSIPDFIMQAGLESIRLFLRNYFEAEASAVRSMRSIEISSTSSLLMQQLVVLLRRFGIWMRVASKQKRATNGSGIFRTYYIGVIGGNSARRFLQEIGFLSTRKQQRLEDICPLNANTNVEGIPASDIVAQAVAVTRLPVRHLGMHNTVYVNGSQQFSRDSLTWVVANVNCILSGDTERWYREQKGSRWTASTLAAYGRLDLDYLLATRQELQRLLDQEVFYCRITSIEDVDYDDWVYDFEVEGHHNFVANNILCHNTIQLTALLLHAKEQGAKDGPTLVICPTSVVGNWRHELARFAPSLRVLVHHGAGRNRQEFAAEAMQHDVLISTYALLHRDQAALSSVAWSDVVLDEAQNIKNPSTKAAQVARKLPARWRAALTGTPVENRLSDLWSIFQFLNPGYLGSNEDFRRRFASPIERGRDPEATARLRTLVSPFVLRRLKTDKAIIADLPEKNEMKTFCILTKEQATLYQAVVQDSLRRIEAAEGFARRGEILAALTKLKQVCDHPALFLKDGSRLSGRSGKLARLTEMLEEALAEGDRALVFTQFAEMGKLLTAHLQEAFGQEVLFLYGATPAPERDRMVAQFQRGDGPHVFVLSIKAGGTGLNLTGASRVFHYDRWWNPAVENQATDRAFRIGQRRDVQVHKFICGGTLEETIDQLIERKVELSEAIVGGGETWITEMSTEQLRELFTLRREDVWEE